MGGGGELVVARGEGSFSPFFLWPPLPSFHSCDLSSAFARPYLVRITNEKHTKKPPTMQANCASLPENGEGQEQGS